MRVRVNCSKLFFSGICLLHGMAFYLVSFWVIAEGLGMNLTAEAEVMTSRFGEMWGDCAPMLNKYKDQ
jgi:hypothetical protein